jgi:hypothetical protein
MVTFQMIRRSVTDTCLTFASPVQRGVDDARYFSSAAAALSEAVDAFNSAILASRLA